MTLQSLMVRLSPRHKLLLAGGAVAALALLAPGGSAAGVARLILGLCAAGGLVWWFGRSRTRAGRHKGARSRSGADGFSAELALALAEPRLEVLSRTGLSQKCGMALVEADGRRYLVVFGDGFAQVHETQRPPASAAVAPALPEVAS